MIPQGYSQNFQMLLKAVRNGDLCLLECFDPTTREPRYAICAVNIILMCQPRAFRWRGRRRQIQIARQPSFPA